MLAEALANALSDFFMVNPSMIETRLIREAGITLSRIELKPQQMDLNDATCAEVTGTVKRVSFQWAWGKDDKKGTDWIKDVNLVLEGLCFQVQLSEHTGEKKEESRKRRAAARGSE